MFATTSMIVSAAQSTSQLRLSSGHGPITRTVLNTPLRDATPSEIPIIDVSDIYSSSLSSRQAVAQQIHAAAANMGFFYISHHGIPAVTIQDAYEASLDFFRQDTVTKMHADIKQSAFYNGYRPPKTQSLNPDEGIDIRESFSFTYDPRFDPTVASVDEIPASTKQYMTCEDGHWDATANLPHFKEAVIQYFQACLSLARALTRSFALSLGLEEDHLDSKVEFPDTAFSFNYYPPLSKATDEDGADKVSIGSHTDFQLFTILWQDSVGGLQVLNRAGQWLRAPPQEGTLVVNIGDYLQQISNGQCVSTVHRAQNWSGKERVSIPFFWGFGLHETSGILDEEGKEMTCKEWMRRRVEAMEVQTEPLNGAQALLSASLSKHTKLRL